MAKSRQKFSRKITSSHGLLEVESDYRNYFGDTPDMADQSILVLAGQCGEAQKPGVKSGTHREFRLGNRLRGVAADSRDLHTPFPSGRSMFIDDPGRKGQDLPKETRNVPDFKLSGMHPDGDTADAGIQIVAKYRRLAYGIEIARCP